VSLTRIAGIALILAAIGVALWVTLRGSDAPALTVYGASSLQTVLPAVDGTARYSYAGSETLAMQIRQGAPADLFLAASQMQPDALHAQGLCDAPVPFATNSLALIVPKTTAKISSINDLRAGGLRLAIGIAAVPIGAYTREALTRLEATTILTINTVSLEVDAADIVGKVALGSADAGIVYVTDARVSDTLTTIPLPAAAQPTIIYSACVVSREDTNRDAADAYLDQLTGPAGQAALRAAGFGPLPRA